MRIAYTFRNLESSEAIKNYAEEKLSRLQKYIRGALDAEVTVSLERHLHRVDVTLNAHGARYSAHEESEDMYASIDLAVDKIARQFRDSAGRRTTRKRSTPKLAGVAQALAAQVSPESESELG